MKRLSLLVLVVVFLMIATVGCNAAQGVGKDISNAGQHIQNIGK